MRLFSLLFACMIGVGQSAYCQDKGSSTEEQDELNVWIPNAFTPNSDGANDYWIPVINGREIESYDVVVIDRNGKEVFRSQNPGEVWNGSVMGGSYVSSPSIFLYYLKLKVAGDLENKVYQGHIVMVR